LTGWRPKDGLFWLIASQRGHLFPWVPVLLGIGIGWYFGLEVEPGLRVLVGLAVAGVWLLIWAWLKPDFPGPIASALAFVMLGAVVAAFRTHDVAAPVLPYRYYGSVEGRVVGIDRSVSDKLRLTLDHVVLEQMDPKETPARVRVSLHGKQGFIDPQPGMVVILTANLDAPNGPVEPGSFDFQRNAWFDGLGAVGYTRSPVLELIPPDPSDISLWLFDLRMAMSRSIQAGIDGQAGAFAAALMTGDRSGMTEDTTEALRVSNLAHLISISGLHMVLMTGTVFTRLADAIVAGSVAAFMVTNQEDSGWWGDYGRTVLFGAGWMGSGNRTGLYHGLGNVSGGDF
jgi:competence protein ComEC